MAWKVKFEEDPDTQYPPESVRPDKFEYPLAGHKVEVTVEKVYGCCAVSVEGDKMTFTDVASPSFDECDISGDLPLFIGSAVKGTKAGTLCTIALKAIYPYIVAMDYGVSAVDLGIAKSGEDGFVVCAAWGPPNCEAQVIFSHEPSLVAGIWLGVRVLADNLTNFLRSQGFDEIFTHPEPSGDVPVLMVVDVAEPGSTGRVKVMGSCRIGVKRP